MINWGLWDRADPTTGYDLLSIKCDRNITTPMRTDRRKVISWSSRLSAAGDG